MVLPAMLAALTSAVLFAACASFARAEPSPPAVPDVTLPSVVRVSAHPGTSVPNPYSFADLFHLTVGAQYGLISGAAPAGPAGGVPPGRPDWTYPTPYPIPLTPALFGGANVPSLALGPSASAAGAMIGIPQSHGPSTGDYAVRMGGAGGPVFRFEQDLLPLGDMPQPAGWLIAASALAVAFFIARRRAGSV